MSEHECKERGILSAWYWNIGNLKRIIHDEDFRKFVESLDLVAFAETGVKTTKEAPCIEGMELVGFGEATKRKGARENRSRIVSKGRPSGGLCVYARNELAGRFIAVPTDRNDIIRLDCEDSDLSIFCIYCAPQGSEYNDLDFFRVLSSLISVENVKSKVVILGDFNARIGEIPDCFEDEPSKHGQPFVSESWGVGGGRKTSDLQVNKLGREFIKFLRKEGMRVLNGRLNDHGDFTFLGHQGRSLIDYGVVNEECSQFVTSFRVGERVESDHLPIAVSVVWAAQERRDSEEEKVRDGVKGKRFRWIDDKARLTMMKLENILPALEEFLNDKEWEDKLGSTEIAEKCDSILNDIFADMKLSEHKVKSRKKSVQNKENQLRYLKKEVRARLRKFRRNKCESSFTKYWTSKKNLEETKLELLRNKIKEESDVLEGMLASNNWVQLWSKIKSYTGKRAATGGQWKISEKEWLTHFEKLFNVSFGETKQEWTEPPSSGGVEFLDGDISSREVMNALRSMKGGSAPGSDGFPMKIFKMTSKLLCAPLAKLFSGLYRAGKFPAQWSHAIIHPIYKGQGRTSDPNNYRGIALLPSIGKIFSKILNNRLYAWAEGEGKLSEFQAGFRRGRSTIDQCFILSSILRKRKRRGVATYVCFVDLKKAFDSVNRDALFFKLAKMGVSEKFIKLLREKYKGCAFSVRDKEGRLSPPIASKVGVMQGDQLSPLLFNLFINDLTDKLKDLGDRYAPSFDGVTSVPLLKFADDVGALSTTRGGLQKMVSAINEFCDEWNLKINADKTQIVEFRKGKRKTTQATIWIGGNKLREVDSYKYLGLRFNYNLSWQVHLDMTRDKVRVASRALRKAVFRFGSAKIDFPLHLFDVMIKPICLYGAEIFGPFANFEKLNAETRGYLKAISGQAAGTAGIGIETILGRMPIEVDVKIRMLMYWFRLKCLSNNSLVEKAFKNEMEDCGRGTEGWASNIKACLDSLGLSYLWEGRSMRISKNKFKKMIKRRLIDQEISKRLEEGRKFSSCSEYIQDKRTVGIEPILLKMSGEQRRKFIRFALGSTGALVDWTPEGKLCHACQSELDCEIFEHRIIQCSALDKKRKKFLVENDLKSRFLRSTVLSATRTGDFRFIPFL